MGLPVLLRCFSLLLKPAPRLLPFRKLRSDRGSSGLQAVRDARFPSLDPLPFQGLRIHSENRCHGAFSGRHGFIHEFSPFSYRVNSIFKRHRSRRNKRRIFSEAVAGGEIRGDAGFFKLFQYGDARCQQRRLRIVCKGQFFGVTFKMSELSFVSSVSSASSKIRFDASSRSYRSFPIPIYCDPCPGNKMQSYS